MKAMILAAGRGERLRPLTDKVPKPLVQVHGKPLIVYHIEKLATLGITDIVVNYAWLGDKITQYLGDGSRFGVNIKYSPETTALETAGGIKQALPLLGPEPFLVLNGDIFIDDLPISRLQIQQGAERLLHGKQACLWLVDNPEHHPEGDFALSDSLLMLDGSNKLTFSGMAIYQPRLFDDLPSGASPLGPLLKTKIAAKEVTGIHYQQYWCDVGTLARLARVERHVALN